MAPCNVSARAKQLASLAMTTGIPRGASRSFLSGIPLRQVALEFFNRPVSLSSVPGVPMPRTFGSAPMATLASFEPGPENAREKAGFSWEAGALQPEQEEFSTE